MRAIADHQPEGSGGNGIEALLAELKSRLALIEGRQHELAANLREAHLAFRRLVERVDDLARRDYQLSQQRQKWWTGPWPPPTL